jgi:hypothetical protein
LAARHLVKLGVELARLELGIRLDLLAALPPVGVCAGELLLALRLLADVGRGLLRALAL